MRKTGKNNNSFLKNISIVVLVIVFMMFFLVGCKRETETAVLEEAEITEDLPVEAEQAEEKPEIICVHVCGQVARPGVYELAAGSRIYEAMEMAGGMLETAAGDALNQAEQMEDGQKIYVPSVEEVQEGQVDPGWSVAVENTGDEGKVNINLADEEELMTLTGIGEKRAKAIIDYRENHGSFRSVEELMEVEGIKTGTYEKIQDRIKV